MDEFKLSLKLFKLVDDLGNRMAIAINNGEDTYEIKKAARDALLEIVLSLNSKEQQESEL